MFFTKKRLKVVLLSSIIAISSIISSVGVNAAFTNPSSTNSNYNRLGANNYMYSHTTNPNTAYHYYGGQGGDCTNFASQVVQSGGMSFTSRSSSPTYNHWYYYYSSWGWGRTATWTGAHEFRQHWGDVNNWGKKRAYRMTNYTVSQALTQLNTIWQDVFVGDIIQHSHQSNGETYHSQIVYGYPTGDITIANHSGIYGNSFESLKGFLQLRVSQGRGGDYVSVIQIKKGW